MCPNCRAFITTSDRVCPYCDISLEKRSTSSFNPAGALGGLIPHARFTTVVILLINTGLFIAMYARDMRASGTGALTDFSLRTLVDFGAKFGPFIRQGEWWRLLTAGFLHGGLLHFLMNSWVLFDLGTHTEESYGTPRYLVFYVVSTITGFYASYWWSPGSVSIGSSAGIFGLIGAMIALGIGDRSMYGMALRRMYTQWAVYGLLMGLLPFFATDNAAHVGGLIGGFAVAYLAGPQGRNGSVEMFWKWAGVAAVLVTLGAFALMLRGLMAVARF